MGYKPKYLGHANLYVRDVERSEKFYTEVLGLHVNEREGPGAPCSCPQMWTSPTSWP